MTNLYVTLKGSHGTTVTVPWSLTVLSFKEVADVASTNTRSTGYRDAIRANNVEFVEPSTTTQAAARRLRRVD
jgi:hypothetical protein